MHRFEVAPLPSIARSPAYRWWVVSTVCIGAFMGQLDASIAQLVLPTLQRSFHASLTAVSWVALSYLLVLAATLPIFGRLADIYGRKLLYTAGFVVFILGSGLCGLAPSLPMLLAARVLQALGAGLLQANSVAIVTAAAGPEHRGKAIGIQGAAQALGLSFGPALGGLLIQELGWRWVFWINVPAGLIGAVLGWLVLPQTAHTGAGERRFDWMGAVLLMPALVLLVLGISEMPEWGLSSRAFLTCVVVGALLLVVFIVHQRRADPPLIDLGLFRSPAFSAGNLTGLISYGLLFGVFLLLPFVLERGYADPPFAAGVRLTAIPIALGIVAPFSGAISDRIGARVPTVGGMLLVGLSLVVLAVFVGDRGAALGPMTAALLIFGVGEGIFTAPNNSAIMGAAPHERLGAAGGVLNVTRTLGTTLGVAAASALLTFRIAAATHGLRDSADATPHELLTAAREVLMVFAGCALVAALLSLFRGNVATINGVDAEPVGGV